MANPVCRYNGVELSYVRSSISSRPVPDGSGRAVMWMEYALTVEGFVTGDEEGAGEVSLELEDIRRRLAAPAAPLEYSDKGFGDLTVNDPAGDAWDASWGPWPEVLEWTPLGGDGNAVRVVWKVTTRIPECDDTEYEGLSELCYTVSFDQDRDNRTTETVQGFLAIALTRWEGQGERVPPEVADDYRDRLQARQPLDGWARTNRKITVSMDRRRIDFSWTDVPMEMPYPDGVSSIQFRQTVENTDRAFRSWQVVFDATITMTRGVPHSRALQAFLLVASSRLAKWKARRKEVLVMPTRLRIAEEVMGRPSSFSLALFAVERKSPQDFLRTSGLWEPIKGTSYARWAKSMRASGARDAYGPDGLRYEAEEDFIVDLCDPDPQPMGEHELFAPGARPEEKPKKKPVEEAFRVPDPPPPAAWLRWECRLEWSIDDPGNAAHRPLPADPVQPVPGGLPPGEGGAAGGRGGFLRDFNEADKPRPLPGLRPMKGPAGPDVLGGADDLAADPGPASPGTGNGPLPAEIWQAAAGPARRVRLRGVAVRAGREPSIPRLLTVGGIKAVPLPERVAYEVIGLAGRLPIVKAMWDLSYAVPAHPARLPLPAEPMLGIDGKGR